MLDILNVERFIYTFVETFGNLFEASPLTGTDIREAFDHLLAVRAAEGVAFTGDEYDREVMRDILLVRKDIQKPWLTEYETRLKYYTQTSNVQEGA